MQAKLGEASFPAMPVEVIRHHLASTYLSVLIDLPVDDAAVAGAAFVEYIRSVAPPGGFRIMPDVETIRHISQTLYARPFRDWRYDAAYGTKRWAYERMRTVAEAFLSYLGEER